MFIPLAFAVSSAVFGSLIISLTVIPVFASFLFGKFAGKTAKSPVIGVFQAIYTPVLDFSLTHPAVIFTTCAVVAAAGTPPQIHVKLVGHVTCGSSDGAVSAATTAPAHADKLSGIVAAFQSAADKALVDLGAQLETRCFAQQ